MKSGLFREPFNTAEDLVPSAAIQFVEDLAHLKRGHNRLDQNGRDG